MQGDGTVVVLVLAMSSPGVWWEYLLSLCVPHVEVERDVLVEAVSVETYFGGKGVA